MRLAFAQAQIGLKVIITGWTDRARDKKGSLYTSYTVKVSAGNEGVPWEARHPELKLKIPAY